MSITRGIELSKTEQRKLIGISRWKAILDNRKLRMDCPNSYHDELLRAVDELQRLNLVTWEEWRDLRREADAAYLGAVAGLDYQLL